LEFAIDAEQLPDGTRVLLLAGELDLYTAPDVEEALLELLSAGAMRVVVDLSDVTFIDSVALGVIVRARKELGTSGTLGVVCPPGVSRFFEVAGLDRILPIASTRAEAVERLGRPAGST
jgi:anti-sigma B factor antagonist